jgi:hypothetical protein
METTSTTFTINCDMPAVTIRSVPNLNHPVFKENPARNKGVESALNYLHSKGRDVLSDYGHDLFDVICY